MAVLNWQTVLDNHIQKDAHGGLCMSILDMSLHPIATGLGNFSKVS